MSLLGAAHDTSLSLTPVTGEDAGHFSMPAVPPSPSGWRPECRPDHQNSQDGFHQVPRSHPHLWFAPLSLPSLASALSRLGGATARGGGRCRQAGLARRQSPAACKRALRQLSCMLAARHACVCDRCGFEAPHASAHRDMGCV